MKKLFTLVLICLSAPFLAQKPITIINQDWDNNQWNDESRITNNYGSNDHILSSLEEEWTNPPGVWQNNTLTTFQTLPSGNIEEYISQSWIVPASVWANAVRASYTYANDKPKTIDYYNWVTDTWVNYMKMTNDYDGAGFLVSELQQSWESTESAWENISLTNYTNLPNGNIEQSIMQIWDDDENQWVNSMRNIHDYSANRLSTIVTQMWMGTDWINLNRETYTYDSNGREWTQKEEKWNMVTSQWENRGLTTYTYDANGDVTEELYQAWENTAWVNDSRTVFTYSGSTGIEMPAGMKIRLFPNPAGDYLYIESSDVESTGSYQIVAINGKIILQNKLLGNMTRVDLTALPAGVYLVKTETNKMKTIKKFTKK